MEVRIISWRTEDEKVIFTAMIDGNDAEFELPEDVYQELLTEGPPTKAKMMRELLNEIHRIQKDRALKCEEIDKEVEVKRDELKSLRGDLLQNADSHVEVNKYKAAIGAIDKELSALNSRRHLAKFLMQEEGRVRADLVKLEHGK